MLPKEHGAWNVLFISLTAGWLALGRWETSALAASLFFLLGFILRAPLATVFQYRRVDAHRANRALILFALETVLLLATLSAFLFLAPPPAIRLLVWGALPVGVLLAGLFLRKRSLRFPLGEALGFLGLNLAAPVLYLCRVDSAWNRALWLYVLFAGQSVLALTYVKVRQGWLQRSRKGDGARGIHRWKDGAWTLALHGALALGILACPQGGLSLSLAPTAAFLRAVGGVAFGEPTLPIMKLGLREMGFSLVYMVLALAGWTAA